LGKGAAAVDKRLGGEITKMAREEGIKWEMGKSIIINTLGKMAPSRVLLMGLGKRSELSAETLRKMAISATKRVGRFTSKLSYALDVPWRRGYYGALAEGSYLGSYLFNKYKSDPEDESALSVVEILSQSADRKAFAREVELALSLARATNFTRDLVNEPPMYLTPTRLAEIAQEIADENGLSIEIFDRDEMMKRGMEGILAVNKGSDEPPKFIHFTYTPKRKPKRTVAVVGKGITFDSGGLSLKPADSMRTMKCDMAGAGVVMGVMTEIAKLKPAVTVHGLISSTENMTGGSAYKVDDVVRIMNGKTVEVINTDAEGRIVLADALSFAHKLRVDEIVDLATLTGACMVALGPHTAGLMGNNAALVEKIKRVAHEAGEKVWQLPLDSELKKQLDSGIADMKNVGARWGGAITAALFLENFVASTPWAHLDIAGPAYSDKGGEYIPPGGTGFGVRTIIRYLLER